MTSVSGARIGTGGLFVPKPSSRATVLGKSAIDLLGLSANVRQHVCECGAIVPQLVTRLSARPQK